VDPSPGNISPEPPLCATRCPLAQGLPPGRSLRIEAVLSVLQALAGLVVSKTRPLLVVCRGRSRAEQISRRLSERLGETVPFYHPGLGSTERAELRNWFLSRPDAAAVATPGAAGELIRRDLRTLIQARLPPEAGTLAREAAWAGRDLNGAEIIVLLVPAEPPAPRVLSETGVRCPYGPDAMGAPGGRGLESCRFGSAYRQAAHTPPPGWREIVAALAANNRLLSLRELCLLLAGRGGFAILEKKLYMYTGYGYLYQWLPEDIAEAVSALLAGGTLRIPRRGAWRRRAALVHREVWWKIHFRNY
jgi:hypothetical protein